MQPDQIVRYEQTRDHIIKEYDRIMEDVENYNPFEGNTQEILDTDYDNFLYLYSCKQHEEMINAKGQSQSLV